MMQEAGDEEGVASRSLGQKLGGLAHLVLPRVR